MRNSVSLLSAHCAILAASAEQLPELAQLSTKLCSDCLAVVRSLVAVLSAARAVGLFSRAAFGPTFTDGFGPSRVGFNSTKTVLCVCTTGIIAPIVRRFVNPYESEIGVVTIRVSALATD